jgi:hypothetical protein
VVILRIRGIYAILSIYPISYANSAGKSEERICTRWEVSAVGDYSPRERAAFFTMLLSYFIVKGLARYSNAPFLSARNDESIVA